MSIKDRMFDHILLGAKASKLKAKTGVSGVVLLDDETFAASFDDSDPHIRQKLASVLTKELAKMCGNKETLERMIDEMRKVNEATTRAREAVTGMEIVQQLISVITDDDGNVDEKDLKKLRAQFFDTFNI